MKSLFDADAERFTKFSLRFNDVLFDYSKNILTAKTIQLLQLLAEECNVKEAIEALQRGRRDHPLRGHDGRQRHHAVAGGLAGGHEGIVGGRIRR